MTPPHTLTDPYNRRLSYLRLSVTDLCNYRCTYCLPDGYQGKAKPDELTLPEIETLVGVFAAAGKADFTRTGGGAHAYQGFDFGQGEFVGLGFALVAVG